MISTYFLDGTAIPKLIGEDFDFLIPHTEELPTHIIFKNVDVVYTKQKFDYLESHLILHMDLVYDNKVFPYVAPKLKVFLLNDPEYDENGHFVEQKTEVVRKALMDMQYGCGKRMLYNDVTLIYGKESEK